MPSTKDTIDSTPSTVAHASPRTQSWRHADAVLATQIGDEKVLMSVELRHYAFLNTTASAIWDGLESAATVPQLVDTLRATFRVELEQCWRDVEALLAQLAEYELITPVTAFQASPCPGAPEVEPGASDRPMWATPSLRLTSVALTADQGGLGGDFSAEASSAC